MSRVFYPPQHQTQSTRHSLALCRMRLTSCWVSADERQYWKILGSPPGFKPPPSVQQAGVLPQDHSAVYISIICKCCIHYDDKMIVLTPRLYAESRFFTQSQTCFMPSLWIFYHIGATDNLQKKPIFQSIGHFSWAAIMAAGFKYISAIAIFPWLVLCSIYMSVTIQLISTFLSL